jgi:hypothetical protein
MENLMQTSRQHRPPPPLPTEEPFIPVVDNIIFIWLDTYDTDYVKCRDRFCKETHVDPQQWLFYEKNTECQQFIQTILPPKKVILVTSGKLGRGLIETLHDSEQVDSIYIYCQDIEKHKQFAQPYKKVVGVYSNPVEIFSRLRDNLDKKAEETPPLSAPPSPNIERFCQPDISWNPWETNICTKTLPIKGQATIAVISNGSIPFDIVLSNASKLPEISGENNYSIIVHVDKHEVTLGTFINNQARLLDRTNESHYILQLNNNNEEYIYWISFSKENLTVMYGIGEIRPKFKVLEARLDAKHSQSISNISYLHVKIIGTWKNFQTIEYLKDKIQFLIGSDLLIEPNLLILRQSQQSLLNNTIFYSGISPLNLAEPCRLLYHSLIHFKLDDDDFPDLIQAIEYSIKNPKGWCHQKITEKANRFGRLKREISYLRLTLDTLVIEIWPP